MPLSTTARVRSAFEGSPPPSRLVFVRVYRRRFCHKQQRPNSKLHLFNFYKPRSVLCVLAGSVSPVHHLSFPPSSVVFMSIIACTSGRLHSEFVCLLFLQAHRETDRFVAASGVQLAQSTSGQFHYKRAAFSSQLKSKCGNILAKAAALRITLNVDDTPMSSRSHTHPSHSQTARLLTSSMSLGITVPRAT